MCICGMTLKAIIIIVISYYLWLPLLKCASFWLSERDQAWFMDFRALEYDKMHLYFIQNNTEAILNKIYLLKES